MGNSIVVFCRDQYRISLRYRRNRQGDSLCAMTVELKVQRQVRYLSVNNGSLNAQFPITQVPQAARYFFVLLGAWYKYQSRYSREELSLKDCLHGRKIRSRSVKTKKKWFAHKFFLRFRCKCPKNIKKHLSLPTVLKNMLCTVCTCKELKPVLIQSQTFPFRVLMLRRSEVRFLMGAQDFVFVFPTIVTRRKDLFLYNNELKIYHLSYSIELLKRMGICTLN